MRNLNGIYTIWLRDVKRFWRDKPRIVGAVAQPTLFLFILGTGLAPAFSRGGGGDYIKFLYPGIISMTVLFTSIFSAISIIWDREFGFLKEVLVAPISRTAVGLGKALGGSTVAMMQGTIMLVFAPLVGVPLGFVETLKIMVIMFLISFCFTSMGLAVAARMKSMEGFQMVMNFFLLPMFFLSGAMFPIQGLPVWMKTLVRIDPLSYGVDALRSITIGVAQYSMLYDLTVITVVGAVMITIAVVAFNLQD
jgi:ABC-2 type transport system permease protein